MIQLVHSILKGHDSIVVLKKESCMNTVILRIMTYIHDVRKYEQYIEENAWMNHAEGVLLNMKFH